MMNEVRENVDRIRRELAEASEGRYPTPRLMAVTKTRGAEEILPLVGMGITEIGENRVQEAGEKFPAIFEQFPSAELHMIGSLQSNKVKNAVKIASCIESVDRISLMDEIEKQCAKIEKTI